MPDWFFYLALAVFGLVFGSFANVVIYRYPRSESLSYPPSHCPRCDAPIAWYDNVPVISWVLLSARCRSCGEPISARYPSVELASGILWLVAGLVWGQSLRTVFGIAFFYLLLILALIDIDTMRLPNGLVATLAIVGVIGVGLSEALRLDVLPLVSSAGIVPGGAVVQAAVGAVLAGGLSALLAGAYRLVRHKQGFGMGDLKLLVAIGLFLGPYALLALFAGSILGAAYGVIASTAKRLEWNAKFPFGPFLAAGAALTSLVGAQLLTWYVGILR